MKCKHGRMAHERRERWAQCILGTDYQFGESVLCDVMGKPIIRHWYKEKEYTWKDILRFCELKAFL